ncbi:MAG: hypothetical protein K6E98_08190 [Lachnospiraceae bacterium]|nr:hypothetical protein [Lachnospiraceae bacterium]
MFDRILANYLVDTSRIGPESLEAIFDLQARKRVRLGVIAQSEGLMTANQVEEINKLQSVTDKRFGDLAVEKGYLTDNQVSRLLTLQGNGFLSFVQSVVDLEYLTMNQIVEALNEFQQSNGYTLTDMESFKSCDIDRIIPIYLYDLPAYAKELISVAIRAMSRLVDYHVYIERPYMSDKLVTENLCYQASNGDFSLLLAVSGNADVLMRAAIGFAGEQYISDIDDSLDSICELINCINGMFATDISHRFIYIDMVAPKYIIGDGVINSENIINIPLHLFDKVITMSVILSDNYTIE